MTKSYIKKVSFKLFLQGVQVRCRTQWRRKLIPSVRAGEREGSSDDDILTPLVPLSDYVYDFAHVQCLSVLLYFFAAVAAE